MSCLELCIALGKYCKLLCLTCNFVFKCKGIRDASFLRYFRIGQIYLILRTTHIHALLHVLSWLHHWLSPLCTPPPTHNVNLATGLGSGTLLRNENRTNGFRIHGIVTDLVPPQTLICRKDIICLHQCTYIAIHEKFKGHMQYMKSQTV